MFLFINFYLAFKNVYQQYHGYLIIYLYSILIRMWVKKGRSFLWHICMHMVGNQHSTYIHRERISRLLSRIDLLRIHLKIAYWEPLPSKELLLLRPFYLFISLFFDVYDQNVDSRTPTFISFVKSCYLDAALIVYRRIRYNHWIELLSPWQIQISLLSKILV